MLIFSRNGQGGRNKSLCNCLLAFQCYLSAIHVIIYLVFIGTKTPQRDLSHLNSARKKTLQCGNTYHIIEYIYIYIYIFFFFSEKY